jgi:hypothetical protein
MRHPSPADIHDAGRLQPWERPADHGVLNAVFVKIIPPDQGYLPLFP